jgi:recombination protein RecR
MPDSIEKLKSIFSKFPTVGQRTASRFVFYLIKQSKENIDELCNTLQQLKSEIKFCNFCFNPHGNSGSLCQICQNPTRNKNLLCLVEKEADLISIENTKRFNGIYFVLAKDFVSLRTGVENLRLEELKQRILEPLKFGIQNTNFSEIILATNPTPEGRTASILTEKFLKEVPQFANIKITHLAKGLPVGGELEYADEETLESAFEGRK